MTSTADLEVRPVTTGLPAVDTEPSVTPRRGTAGWLAALPVLVLATAAVLARMPFLTRPLSPDEGGFLMVAAQWSPGTSLYGDYWVDRPPLLVTLFELAGHLGGGVGLRLLGAASVGATVLIAAASARALTRLGGTTPRHPVAAAVCAAATAAVFLVSPLSGALEVDGELLAAPFVLAGLTAALTAYTARRQGLWWWTTAGVLAVAAAGVKQNMLETFVAAAVLLLATARDRPRVAVRAAGGFAAGAAAAMAVLLGWAASHGTTPAALWDAVFSFRFEASAVIAHSAPATAQGRALGVAGAFLASGAVALIAVALAPAVRRRGVRRPSLAAVVTAAVLGWELVAVAAGGSFWLHYLVGTTAGLVLTAALAASAGRARRVAVGAVLAYAATVALVGVVMTTLSPIGTPAADLAVERYLSAHEGDGDTGLVAFGDPALLQAAHLSSPYPELWSLPVRVRDPRLTDLTAVLEGSSRPTWVVVDGASLGTWGVDPSLAQPVLDREYRLAHISGDWHVYHLRTEAR